MMKTRKYLSFRGYKSFIVFNASDPLIILSNNLFKYHSWFIDFCRISIGLTEQTCFFFFSSSLKGIRAHDLLNWAIKSSRVRLPEIMCSGLKISQSGKNHAIKGAMLM